MKFFFGANEPEFDRLEAMVDEIRRASAEMFPQKNFTFHEDLLLFGLDNAVRAIRAGVDPQEAVRKAFIHLQKEHREVRP